jgi:hypothetical protein
MPIEIIITEQVSNGMYKAVGTCFNSEISHKMNVFIAKEGNQVSMHTSKQYPGKIANAEIEHITPHEPVLMDDLEIGTKLTFISVHVSIKNPN